MTPETLALLLHDVAVLTKTTGAAPDLAWVEERAGRDAAVIYDRLLNPEPVAVAIAEALLDAGADLDFDRYGADPDNARDVWGLVRVRLPGLLDAHGVTSAERGNMQRLVEAEFLARF